MPAIAPPPAAPPPPPPPSPPMGGSGGETSSIPAPDGPPRQGGTSATTKSGVASSKTSSKSPIRLFQGCFGTGSAVPSYQKDAFTPTRDGRRGTRAAEPPVIENYGTDEHTLSSDPSLNPNVAGISNSAEGAGTALPELILRMRIINLILCTLALGLEVPTWLGRALLGNLSALVLGVYLCLFAGLLCCFELHTPVLADMIKDNFGIIYHPYGRALFLTLMGGMCMGQGGLEFILGCVMMVNAAYTIYIPCRYPAYEKAHEESGREDVRDFAVRAAKKASFRGWADPTGEGEGLVSGSGAY